MRATSTTAALRSHLSSTHFNGLPSHTVPEKRSPPGSSTRLVRGFLQVWRFALVLAGVALATALRAWLHHRFGVTSIYILYFPLVLIATSLAGATAGMATIALSALAADWFFLPGSGLTIASVGERINFALFIAMGLAIVFVAHIMRVYADRNRQQAEQVLLTEQRLFDESVRLHDAQLRLAAIVEASSDAIIGKDTRGNITSWNHGAERIFGYTAFEMIGQSVRRLLPPDHAEEEDEILRHLLRKQPLEHFETVRVSKTGRNIHTSLTISPLLNPQGEVFGVATIARDMTKTRSLQHQLLHARKLEAAGQVADGVAHDFNNLLGIILGALDLQEPTIADNPLALEPWSIARSAAQRGGELTRRLLAAATLEPLSPEPTNLTASLRDIVELARHALGREIVVQSDLHASLPLVLVDLAGLENAVLNLAINARDAMPNGGKFSISTSLRTLDEPVALDFEGTLTPGTFACISVSDTGIGNPDNIPDRGFEPLFTTKPFGRGAGLGLATAYGFAKQSHGAIRIASEPDRGTTVLLYLPVAHAATTVLPS